MGSCGSNVKCFNGPTGSEALGALEEREWNQGMLHESVAFMLIVEYGVGFCLLPFGRIRGKGFVAGKCWSLPEHLAQEGV